VIVSSWAIHNIPNLTGRSQAIDEIARALSPGGRVTIADLAWTRVYAEKLEALGQPSVMVIPHWDHWAHIAAFKKRYPKIDVVCPRASIDRVREHLKVEYSCEEYFPRNGVTAGGKSNERTSMCN